MSTVSDEESSTVAASVLDETSGACRSSVGALVDVESDEQGLK